MWQIYSTDIWWILLPPENNPQLLFILIFFVGNTKSLTKTFTTVFVFPEKLEQNEWNDPLWRQQ